MAWPKGAAFAADSVWQCKESSRLSRRIGERSVDFESTRCSLPTQEYTKRDLVHYYLAVAEGCCGVPRPRV
jgi:hypothetical protein